MGHEALDASDVYYLKELDGFLSKSADPSDFYQNLLNVLVGCDSSQYSSIAKDAQTVSTDFFAIYTAELDRNMMTGLKQHPWENDLAEVTLLSAYGNRAGMIEKSGQFVEGSVTDYFGVGQTGSGIGETRKDRTALQLLVSNAERKLHPSLMNEIDQLIGTKPNQDVIHGLMVYLNNPKNQSSIHQNADRLVKTMLNFLSNIHSDDTSITQSIKNESA